MKAEAEGSTQFRARQLECSNVLREEYAKYIQRTKQAIEKLPSSSKKWWAISSKLSFKARKISAFPPLRDNEGQWHLTAESKANLLAASFASKFGTPAEIENGYSKLPCGSIERMTGFLPVRARSAAMILRDLRTDSASGPDLLAARVLRRFAK